MDMSLGPERIFQLLWGFELSECFVAVVVRFVASSYSVVNVVVWALERVSTVQPVRNISHRQS